MTAANAAASLTAPSIDRIVQNIWGLRYIDDLVLRRVDANYPGSGLPDFSQTASGDIDWEQYLTDHQFSVVAAVGRTGTLAFRVAYDAYGEARHLPAKDINGDGKVDSADTAIAQAAVKKRIGEPGYNPDADWDRDGTVTSTDIAQFGSRSYIAALPQGQLAQPGGATQPAAGDTSPAADLARAANARSDFNIGFSGYRFNGDIGAYTVRFRHYDPTPGMCRWLERDPAGYQDGPSLYSYLGRNPMAGTDPYGLFYSGSGITVIAPDQIRPPVGASELVNPPGYGLRPTLLPPGMPGNNEVLAWAEALSAIARTNAERGVDNGLGFWDSLLLSDSPLHLTLQSIGFIPGLGEPVDVIDGIIYALEGDTVNAGISFSAAIPGIGWGATSARWGKRAADIADKANDARKAAVVGEAAAKSARTTHKSWPSARAAYWKAFGPGGEAPKRQVLVRIKKTGQVREITQTKELHHRVARRDGGTHDFDNLMEVWPDEHALREIDPHRHTGYEVLEVLSGP